MIAKRAKIMDEKQSELKPEIEPKEAIPSLVRMEEFLQSISKDYPVESLGGFIFWVKRNGVPKRWPVHLWKQKLEEYLGRKI